MIMLRLLIIMFTYLAFLKVNFAIGQTEQNFTNYSRFSPGGLLLGKFSAKVDDKLGHLAERYTYNEERLLKTLEKGTLASWQDEDIDPARWPLDVQSAQTFDYDDFGRKIVETTLDKNKNKISLVEFTYGDSSTLKCHAVRMNLTALGNACTLSNANSANPDRITRYTYDERDQPITEERAVGTKLEHVYKSNVYEWSILRFQIDANCNTTEFKYDNAKRLKQIVYPAITYKISANDKCKPYVGDYKLPINAGPVNPNDYQEFGYDSNGNKNFERKRNKKTVNSQYDNNNRLILKDYQDNTTLHDIAYEYDLRGLQTNSRFDDLGGEGLSNEYDGFGNLVRATNSLTGITRTVQSSYDLNNNRESITHPDNQIFYYAFDAVNRVTGVSTNSGVPEGLLGVKYQANGRRQNIIRPNGSTTTFNFNNGVQLSSVAHTFVSNAFGSTNYDISNRFEYNAAGQITLMGQSNKLYNYTGNADRAGTYVPDGLNRYRGVAGQDFIYDENSNLTFDGIYTYTYDDENRLLTARGSGVNAQFLYDPNGRLFQYVVNGSVHQFLYDGEALIGDYLNGILQNRFVHGDQVDEPWIRYSGSKTTDEFKFYLHGNHQGSIIAESSHTSSGTGSVTSTLAYDAYGVARTDNVGLFGYTGQVYLKELGLYYYKARIYSPKLGRFLQTDPIGYKDDMDLYSYVGNDPVNKTDPTGTYGRGEGFTDEQWKKFDKAQQKAAKDMDKTANKLEAKAGKLDGGKADSLMLAAKNLRGGAANLRSQTMVANKKTIAEAKADGRTEGVGAWVPKSNSDVVNVVMDNNKAWGAPLAGAWTIGHESLHGTGVRLSDYPFVDGIRAYKGEPGDMGERFNLIQGTNAASSNPDSLMQMVYPN